MVASRPLCVLKRGRLAVASLGLAICGIHYAGGPRPAFVHARVGGPHRSFYCPEGAAPPRPERCRVVAPLRAEQTRGSPPSRCCSWAEAAAPISGANR